MIREAGEGDDQLQIRKHVFKKAGLALRLLLGAAGLSLLALTASGDSPESAKATAGYAFGSENSWIRVQNVGTADADVDLNTSMRAVSSPAPTPARRKNAMPLFPGSGWTFFQKDSAGLPGGFQGSAVISTDQPVVAILAKDVMRGDRVLDRRRHACRGPGSHRVYLPVTGKHDGPNMDWSGRFVIQNMSDTVQACVQITYLSIQTDSEVAWEPYKLPATGKPVARCPAARTAACRCRRAARFSSTRTTWRSRTSSPARSASSCHEQRESGFGQAVHLRDRRHLEPNLASFGSYRGFDENELGNESSCLSSITASVEQNSYSTRFTDRKQGPEPAGDGHAALRRLRPRQRAPPLVSKTNTFTIEGHAALLPGLRRQRLPGAGRRPALQLGRHRPAHLEPAAGGGRRPQHLPQRRLHELSRRPAPGRGDQGTAAGAQQELRLDPRANGWNSWFRVMVADGGVANVTVTLLRPRPAGRRGVLHRPRRPRVHRRSRTGVDAAGRLRGHGDHQSDRPIVALADIYTDVFQGDPDLVYNGTPLR